MTIAIKPTASGSTIEQNGSTILTVDGSGNISTAYNLSVSGTVSSTGDVAFDTNTLYVDSTNNRVGVGTSSPSVKLDVVGPSGATRGMVLRAASDNGAYLQLTDSGSHEWYVGTPNGTNALVFGDSRNTSTDGTQRMAIDSNGNLLVGITSGFDGGNGITFKSPTNHYLTSWRTTTSTGNYIHAFVSDVTSVGTTQYAIYANGTAGSVSDASKKKNVETSRSYLNDLMNIRVVKYNWISDNDGDAKELGWIAQEVEEVFPAMVSNENGVKMLKKEVFIPMLMTAIQELKTENDTLKSQLSALETRIQALENA